MEIGHVESNLSYFRVVETSYILFWMKFVEFLFTEYNHFFFFFLQHFCSITYRDIA